MRVTRRREVGVASIRSRRRSGRRRHARAAHPRGGPSSASTAARRSRVGLGSVAGGSAARDVLGRHRARVRRRGAGCSRAPQTGHGSPSARCPASSAAMLASRRSPRRRCSSTAAGVGRHGCVVGLRRGRCVPASARQAPSAARAGPPAPLGGRGARPAPQRPRPPRGAARSASATSAGISCWRAPMRSVTVAAGRALVRTVSTPRVERSARGLAHDQVLEFDPARGRGDGRELREARRRRTAARNPVRPPRARCPHPARPRRAARPVSPPAAPRSSASASAASNGRTGSARSAASTRAASSSASESGAFVLGRRGRHVEPAPRLPRPGGRGVGPLAALRKVADGGVAPLGRARAARRPSCCGQRVEAGSRRSAGAAEVEVLGRRAASRPAASAAAATARATRAAAGGDVLVGHLAATVQLVGDPVVELRAEQPGEQGAPVVVIRRAGTA